MVGGQGTIRCVVPCILLPRPLYNDGMKTGRSDAGKRKERMMLEVEHLSYDIHEEGRQSEILSDISFSVEDGEMLDGKDITGFSIDERAKAGMGFAFQQPPRFKGMTVRRLLHLAAGRTLSEDECCNLLSSVGLCAREYIDREADATLSGGEMKRIEIATVLAAHHAICIFDEPEAGIDLWSFSMLVKRFEQIHKEKKESLILISHQERIIRMADRIMVISDGQIESIGKAEEIMPQLFGTEAESCVCRQQKGGDLCGAE